MSFIYSCIGDNSPENREHLEKLGKKRVSGIVGNLIMTFENKYMCIELEGKIGNNFKDAIPYLHSDALFRAVTAMREGSDYMQWFVIDEYRIFGVGGNIVGLEPRKKIGEKWILCDHDDLRLTNSIKQDIIYSYHGKSDMRKATLADLQEHFKRNTG